MVWRFKAHKIYDNIFVSILQFSLERVSNALDEELKPPFILFLFFGSS